MIWWFEQKVVIRSLVVWLVLALSGCQSTQQLDSPVAQPNATMVELQEKKLRKLNNFQFSGGLGIWTDAESISARILWLQSNRDLDLTLTGPMGFGDLQLQDKAGGVTLSRGKTVVTSGTSTDDVVQRGLGLTAAVPIEELKQWVRGLPGTGDLIVRDSDGKLTSLRYFDQSDVAWSVRFKRYEKVGEISLPALISASGGDYSVRLLLKNWELMTNLLESEANAGNNRLSIPGR